MAALTVLLYDLNGDEVEGAVLLSYVFNREDGVPCDSLLLRLESEETLPEINTVKAFYHNEPLFNGTCDCQRETIDSDGRRTLLHARSSASFLTDNEATPRTLTKPTAHTLFLLNAQSYGFQYALPELYCPADYTVTKGTSCFHAIDNFVFALTNRHIAVSPDDRLSIPKGENCLLLDEAAVLSECKITDRGSVVSEIDYKTENDYGYAHHIVSCFAQQRGIQRSKAVSLSALPYWQQNAALSGQLKTAAAHYERLEVKLLGCHLPALYDRITYPSRLGLRPEDYHVTAVTVTENADGVQTALQLSKQIDLEEITYVA